MSGKHPLDKDGIDRPKGAKHPFQQDGGETAQAITETLKDRAEVSGTTEIIAHRRDGPQ